MRWISLGDRVWTERKTERWKNCRKAFNPFLNNAADVAHASNNAITYRPMRMKVPQISPLR
ncbi:hypothetical protein DESC_810018 [Desulfosarcina cetonica]|nr:hypothetical protein DESC_810018 [Desulfosarcina cetonica]